MSQASRVFAQVIEGHQRNLANYRAYINRFGYKTVLAAFLYLEQQRSSSHSRIQSPGKYYNAMVKAWGALGTYDQACQVYTQAYAEGKTLRMPGIPWDIQRLVAQFERWPLEMMIKELRQHPDILQAMPLPSVEKKANEEHLGERKEASWEQGQEREPQTPPQWMGYEESTTLLAQVRSQAAEIEANVGRTCFNIAPTPRAYNVRGTHMEAYVIDVTIEGIPVAFASVNQWKLYYLEQTDLNAYKVFRKLMEEGAEYL
ncbi:hypothetical protein [Ktedonospora formicarum]|uniref:hypothetical protein n=1 Tax=Ktedonospora formicarum TaxID=2778364 RepID=UPI001C68A8B0|nr:hypothetical protein [Ktedonospora formicarum]